MAGRAEGQPRAFFINQYHAKDVSKLSAKVDQAIRSYIKEATESCINKEGVKQDVLPAEAQIAREKQTHNEAVLLAAVLAAGRGR